MAKKKTLASGGLNENLLQLHHTVCGVTDQI